MDSLNAVDARVADRALRELVQPVESDLGPVRDFAQRELIARSSEQVLRGFEERIPSVHVREDSKSLLGSQVTFYPAARVASDAVRPRESAVDVLTRNVRALVAYLNEHPGAGSLAQRRKGRVSQKTLNNILNGRHRPTLKTLEQVADMFGIAAWQLLLPDFSADLILSQDLKDIVEGYAHSDQVGRATIKQIAVFSRTGRLKK